MLRNFIKTNCHLPALLPLVKLGKSINRYYENFNYDHKNNGEERVLKIISQFNPKNIFDVGAYQGTWATVALEHCHNSKVTSFEPIPWAFEKLALIKNDRLAVEPIGLGNQNTHRTLIAYRGDASCLSGFYKYPHKDESTTVEVKVKTGDSYLAENQISTIDFLKMDTEGSEYEVLQGFEESLKAKSVKVIQFEYGQVNIISHYLLRDYFNYLDNVGYRVGKIYPKYVHFCDYTFELENFIGSNFLAVSKNEPDLIKKLSGL